MKEILITSSVLIVVVLVLRLIFAKKVRRTLIYGAWALVALRLLIPVQIGQLQFSVLTSAKPMTEVITEISHKQVAGVNEQDAYRQVLQDYIEDDQTVFIPEVQDIIQSAMDYDTPKEEIAEMVDNVHPERDIYVPEAQPQVQQQVEAFTMPITLGQIATVVWLAGMVLMALWLIVTNLRLRYALRKSKPYPADSPIKVYVSEKVCSPCLVGIFRPAVYLTPESAADENLTRYVLTHELTHYAHGDHIWSLVRCICLCVYWFNPLVWIAAWVSRRDCELACDEGALRRLEEQERVAYGNALLQVVSHASVSGRLILTATTMAETKRQLKQRVLLIARKPKWSVVAAVSLVLIAGLTVGCTFTGAKITASLSRYLPLQVTRYDTTGNPYDYHIYAYDELGRMISDQYICPEEESYHAYTRTYTYNEQGYLASKTNAHLDPSDPDYQHTYLYAYNDSGLVASCRWISGTENLVYHYTYDDQGNLLTICVDTKGGLHTIVKCFYNEWGKLTLVRYEPPGLDRMEYGFEYDKSGKLIRYMRWDYATPNSGPMKEQIIFEYDDFGNLCTVIDEPTFVFSKWSFRYEDNELADFEYYVDDEQRDYTLDSNGNVSSVSDSYGNQTTYSYQHIVTFDDETDPRHLYWNIANEPLQIMDYRDHILYYFLPRVELTDPTTYNLYA